MRYNDMCINDENPQLIDTKMYLFHVESEMQLITWLYTKVTQMKAPKDPYIYDVGEEGYDEFKTILDVVDGGYLRI